MRKAVIALCCPCCKHFGLFGVEPKAAHFWTRADLLAVSEATYMVRQTAPRPLSPCQPRCAEGGAGAQHPGLSLQASDLPRFGKPRGCEVPSPWEGIRGGCPGLSAKQRFLLSRTKPPWTAAPAAAGGMRGLAKGAWRWEDGNSVWFLAEVHFGAADSRGQHADRLAPAAARCAARPAAASPACACLLGCKGNSTGTSRTPEGPEMGEARGISPNVPQVLAAQAEEGCHSGVK